MVSALDLKPTRSAFKLRSDAILPMTLDKSLNLSGSQFPAHLPISKMGIMLPALAVQRRLELADYKVLHKCIAVFLCSISS